MSDYTWQAGSGRNISLKLTMEDAETGNHQGPCDSDVACLAGKLSEQTYLWDAEDLRAELDESGAWDDEELSDHEENIERMIWIACGDVAENPDYYLD